MLYFPFLNISTNSHVATCENALKSVDSYLKPGITITSSQIPTAESSLGVMCLTHINSRVILTLMIPFRKQTH